MSGVWRRRPPAQKRIDGVDDRGRVVEELRVRLPNERDERRAWQTRCKLLAQCERHHAIFPLV
jgi:hypothetical protein